MHNNEIQKKDQKEHESTSTVETYTARGHAQNQNPMKRRKSCSKGKLAKDECAFCHEKGHWKKNCPKLKKKENGKSTSNAALDVCVVKYKNDELQFLLINILKSHSNEGILESGYTYHMCPNNDWFLNFAEQNDGVV